MSDKSNNQGRAYEYICLLKLCEAIKMKRNASILLNSSYKAAERAWDSIGEENRRNYTLSAESVIDTLFALEPRMIEDTPGELHLYIQDDKRGEIADARDLIVKREDIVWEIGLSIKHNHMAVKHSRLSSLIDFGERWYGVSCSKEYWEDVKPVFDNLQKYKTEGLSFNDLDSKEDEIYVPLLKAFIKEVRKQITANPSIPRKMVEYLLSKYDFYKIISVDHLQLTTVQSFNMYGTLNLRGKKEQPHLTVSPMKLPTRLLYMDLKQGSKTTVIMCFDEGWQFSFRIHNAKGLIEPSLKFDIQLVGIPSIVSMAFNCKWADGK